jgi:DNA-binding transcriptional ArsR family regulator
LTLTIAGANVDVHGEVRDHLLPVMDSSHQTKSVLRALAEPRRVAILKLIRRRELRAGQIADNFSTTRSAISQHLRVLTKAGLLSERRRGTSRLYRLRPEGFVQLRALLDAFWEDGLARLKSEAEKHVRSEGGR